MARNANAAFPPEFYINREMSWLEFNARVLEEAVDATSPWLERLKFMSIFSSNLDEFFEVRVAGLKDQVSAGIEPQDYGADGLGPAEQLAAIDKRAHELVGEQYHCLNDQIFPGLAGSGIRRVRYDELTDPERQHVEQLFAKNIYPVLTPLAIDPGHPFPHVHNKSLNIALVIERELEGRTQELFAVVQVPAVLPRVMTLPRVDDQLRYILLEDIIGQHLGDLFGGFRVVAKTVFRVTRDTDIDFVEDEAEDLLQAIEDTLRQRIRGRAVRLEISADADERFVKLLEEALEIVPSDVYRVAGPVDLTALMALQQLDGFRSLKDEPLVPRVPPVFAGAPNLFDVIRNQDVLAHHPFESFGCVVDFIERAANDPQVLAIKQTLYRTSAPSPIIDALARAAINGKQVTALVELKARLDEQNNIVWAKSLEQAGVHVVYGVVGLKTHCKAALVVRREADGLRRYVHLATGNYNPSTSRIYTDLGLFTANPDFGEDVSELFNLLTGYSERRPFKKLVVAPMGLRERVVELINRERINAESNLPARVLVKMNALVEPSVIDALYRASKSGVKIDLLIRGICCLRPGLPGISESIRVVSVVDRFLEHSRIFYFENAGHPEVFLGSADWMPRNFYRRIEVMFPVEAEATKQRIVDEILPTLLAENAKGRVLRTDGSYVRMRSDNGKPAVRSQQVFQAMAREAAIRDLRDGSSPRFVPILRSPQAATE
ncbi:MAG: polyphosphate kinase 1 [Planctomycetes bacterium]|nr:polyphosphate kinase 1 [Planctomycetota bacterium]MBI3834355.1 polyphosphate kinase 1 [Planctomycetota bacterium]